MTAIIDLTRFIKGSFYFYYKNFCNYENLLLLFAF